MCGRCVWTGGQVHNLSCLWVVSGGVVPVMYSYNMCCCESDVSSTEVRDGYGWGGRRRRVLTARLLLLLGIFPHFEPPI